MGGRGASTGRKKGASVLEAMKADAHRLNEAKIQALKDGVTTLKYTDIMGKTHTFYRSGNTWGDRPNSMELAYGRRKEKVRVIHAKV